MVPGSDNSQGPSVVPRLLADEIVRALAPADARR
jgi:hypothetical protein